MQAQSPQTTNHKHAIDAIDEAHFRAALRTAPYFSAGRSWSDYAPAYCYGYATHETSGKQPFEAVEAQLAAGWETQRDGSRLLWTEAREAVRDAWRYLDSTRPSGRERSRNHH